MESMNKYLVVGTLTLTGLLWLVHGLELYVGDNCLAECPVTSDYNPVCGTDSITYINPSRLLCWKKCKDSELGVAHFTGCVDWMTGNYLI